MTASARILRLPSGRSVKLDDGPKSVALVHAEIWRSGLTYQKIADDAGISISTVGNIGSGKTQSPRMATVVRILTALGWEVWASRN